MKRLPACRNAEGSIDRRKAQAVFALAFLAACATTEKAKESWVGASYEDAVRAWGAPQRSGTLADGTQVSVIPAVAGG